MVLAPPIPVDAVVVCAFFLSPSLCMAVSVSSLPLSLYASIVGVGIYWFGNR